LPTLLFRYNYAEKDNQCFQTPSTKARFSNARKYLRRSTQKFASLNFAPSEKPISNSRVVSLIGKHHQLIEKKFVPVLQASLSKCKFGSLQVQ
jgi:aminopeptidase C